MCEYCPQLENQTRVIRRYNGESDALIVVGLQTTRTESQLQELGTFKSRSLLIVYPSSSQVSQYTKVASNR